MNTSIIKQNIRYTWLVLIVCILGYYFYSPSTFEKENIVIILNQYKNHGMLILLFLHILRSFTMLPPTLLIFAGIIMYPNRLFELLIISIIGATLSGVLAYHFADKIDFKVWLNQHQTIYKKVKLGLDSKYGMFFIIGWILFPFVPTDIIGYTAGTTKINFIPYITAVFIGKVILSIVYIYGGEFLLEKIFSF